MPRKEEINIVDDPMNELAQLEKRLAQDKNYSPIPETRVDLEDKFIEPGLSKRVDELQREVVLGNITEEDRQLGHRVLIQIRNWEDFAISQGWFKKKNGNLFLDEFGNPQLEDTVQTEIHRYLTEFGYLFNSSRSLEGKASRQARTHYSDQESRFSETPPKMKGVLGKVQDKFF